MNLPTPLWPSMLAVGVGAALGALLRWALGLGLNALWPLMPAGTLAANLIGGYGIGLVLGWLGAHPELSPLWRLLLATGFLGGLTTFSTFSAEVVGALQQGRAAAAVGIAAAHLVGSLLLTWLGLLSADSLHASLSR